MGILQQLILPEKVGRGALLEACDGRACVRYRVARVRTTKRGLVLQLAEVAGVLAVDPAVAYHDELLAAGETRKYALLEVGRKFGIKRRAILYRLAKR